MCFVSKIYRHSASETHTTSVRRGEELTNGKCSARFHNFISSSDGASRNYASNAFQNPTKVFQNVARKRWNTVVEWEAWRQLQVT